MTEPLIAQDDTRALYSHLSMVIPARRLVDSLLNNDKRPIGILYSSKSVYAKIKASTVRLLVRGGHSPDMIDHLYPIHYDNVKGVRIMESEYKKGKLKLLLMSRPHPIHIKTPEHFIEYLDSLRVPKVKLVTTLPDNKSFIHSYNILMDVF